MTITSKVLTETEENRLRFNEFIAAHPKGHVLQSWEWGRVKAVTGWQPIRIVAEEDGGIVAAVSILKRNLPMGLGCLFYSPRGPVIDMADQEAWRVLQQAVRTEAKKHNASFWKVDPDVDKDFDIAPGWLQGLKSAGFVSVDKGQGFEGVQPRFVFRLDISKDLDTLLAECHQKTRYNIRLARKKGVEIVTGAGKECLPAFYDILTTTASRDHFLIRPYSYFEGFYDHLYPAGQTELFMAYYEGEPIAGTLTFKMGDKAWYIYGASSNAHRNLMPNYLIQWTMIEWAKENGCTMYDFRGVPGDVGQDHPLYGLVKFKKGFNGKYTEFIGEYDLVYRPMAYRLYHFLEPIYQKNMKRLLAFKRRLKGKK